MDYSELFSADTFNFMKSPTREIFKKVDLSKIYSFAGGYPDSDTFPLRQMKELTETVVEKYGGKALQYGGTMGVPELIGVLSKRYDVPEKNILVSTSSQQGIDVCTRVLVDPGDVILTVAPAYLGAIQSFKSYRADIVCMDMTPSFEAAMRRREAIWSLADSGRKIKFFYTIPDFQNPSGETLTLAQRSELVALAREFNFLIVEDAPYRELRYEGDPVATICSLAPERTLHLGTFSKIFAPGLRLGWIVGPEEVLDRIYTCKQSLDLCAPVFNQYLAAEYMESGMLDSNLKDSIALYRHKRDHFLTLLEKYMPEGVTWTHPEGGLFIFVHFPENVNTVELYPRALEKEVAYVAGSFFYPDGSHTNTMRLNFSFMPEEKMEEGIKRLASLL